MVSKSGFKEPPSRTKLNDLTKEEWSRFNTTVWRCSDGNEYFASFHREIPKRLISYLTRKGDKILDPFVGSGTTLIEASRLARPSCGLDISEKALSLAKRKVNALERSGDAHAPINIIKGDAGRISEFFDRESMDFILTSPPYFDIVHYSDDQNQIGNISEYRTFIDTMERVFFQCNEVLRRDKFFVMVTADIRKASQYFPIHIDYVNCCLNKGFKLHQILVNIFKTSGKGKREACMGYPTNFHPWMEHEYILIFQKP